MQELYSTTPEGDEMPTPTDVIIERLNNLTERFARWEDKTEAADEFRNKVLGAVQATGMWVRVIGSILGLAQLIIIGWVTAVNIGQHSMEEGQHSMEERVTKLETSADLRKESENARATTLDNRMNTSDRRTADVESDVEKLKITVDHLDHSKK